MQCAETCSFSLCNKFYTYPYHRTALSDSTYTAIQLCQTVHTLQYSSVRQYIHCNTALSDSTYTVIQLCQTVHTLQYSVIINTTEMNRMIISEVFLILSRTGPDMIKNVYRSLNAKRHSIRNISLFPSWSG